MKNIIRHTIYYHVIYNDDGKVLDYVATFQPNNDDVSLEVINQSRQTISFQGKTKDIKYWAKLQGLTYSCVKREIKQEVEINTIHYVTEKSHHVTMSFQTTKIV